MIDIEKLQKVLTAVEESCLELDTASLTGDYIFCIFCSNMSDIDSFTGLPKEAVTHKENCAVTLSKELQEEIKL